LEWEPSIEPEPPKNTGAKWVLARTTLTNDTLQYIHPSLALSTQYSPPPLPLCLRVRWRELVTMRRQVHGDSASGNGFGARGQPAEGLQSHLRHRDHRVPQLLPPCTARSPPSLPTRPLTRTQSGHERVRDTRLYFEFSQAVDPESVFPVCSVTVKKKQWPIRLLSAEELASDPEFRSLLLSCSSPVSG